MNPLTADRTIGRFDYVVIGAGVSGSIVGGRLAADPRVSVAIVGAGAHDGNKETSARALLRPPDEHLDNWADLGASGWGAAELRPHFERLLQEVPTSTDAADGEFTRAFSQAANRMGYHALDVPHVSGDFTGRLSSLAESGRNMTNLRMFWNASANRLIFNPSAHVVAIDTTIGRIEVGREAIICCGAYATPKLLELSGIGPERLLRALGQDVISDLPAVGQNLMDHIEVNLSWALKNSITEAPDELAVLADSSTSHLAPDLVISFNGLTRPTVEQDSLSMGVMAAIPWSRGTVAVQSLDPLLPPHVERGYLSDRQRHDERMVVSGIGIARQLAEADPFRSIVAEELRPGPDVASDSDLRGFVRREFRTRNHPAGTARMGDVHDRGSVVDSQLRVIGVEGVRVADASVMPSIPGVDTALTCMVIADRCAQFVVQANGAS